jgi:hypothetical protein
MNEIFKNGRKITTISFDGWQIPEEERKLLIDFANDDSGSFIYTECVYDQGTTIFVDTALEYGLNDETIEENPDKPLLRVREILQMASDEGIDEIKL